MQRLANGFKQGRCRHRFGQHIGHLHATFLRTAHCFVPPECRDHDHGRHFAERLFAHLPHGFHTVHDRHLPIDQHQVVGQCLAVGLNHQLQALDTITRHVHLQPEALGHGGQDFAGAGVVVHHQHACALEFFGLEHLALGRILLHPEAGVEVEDGAFASLALDPDAPAHEFDQVFADDQPQPGAAVFARGAGIGLAETLEHLAALLWRHADTGVFDPEVQFDTVVMVGHFFDADDNFAGFGELDGVVAQVDQHLTQPQGVANEGCGYIWRGGKQKFQPFVFGFHAHQVGQVVHDVFKVEVNGFHAQLARFNLGEVEDVVDDAQQVFASAVDFFNVVALLFIQRGLQRQVAHADDGVHGRANFVAHVGQEVALGFGGVFCRLLGAQHLLLSSLAGSDVL